MGTTSLTRIAFAITGPVEINARSLVDPARVIIDLPEVEFRLPRAAGATTGGLVAQYRYGLIEAGKSRIVLDTTAPAQVARAVVAGPLSGGGYRLEIDLRPATAADLAAQRQETAALSRSAPARPSPARPPPRTSAGKPVVVIDPGHGGIDPGASGTRWAEKDLVLDVARQLRRALAATGRYEVVMTRSTDVFVSLEQRVEISQRVQADLFLSLHADSLPTGEATRSVRGATIYTLAEEASDERARRRAESENAADLLAGMPAATVRDDQVRAILIDLMRRESARYASAFRQVLVSRLAPATSLSRDPFKAAPFMVLRQAGSPAVLIELGYMSNREDERLMGSSVWQQKVAAAIVEAVDEHFRRRLAESR